MPASRLAMTRLMPVCTAVSAVAPCMKFLLEPAMKRRQPALSQRFLFRWPRISGSCGSGRIFPRSNSARSRRRACSNSASIRRRFLMLRVAACGRCAARGVRCAHLRSAWRGGDRGGGRAQNARPGGQPPPHARQRRKRTSPRFCCASMRCRMLSSAETRWMIRAARSNPNKTKTGACRGSTPNSCAIATGERDIG